MPFVGNKFDFSHRPFGAFFALICTIVCLFATSARAEISAEASISAKDVGVGEPFQLSVQVTADDNAANLPWPTVEGLDKFTVAKSTGTSRSMQTSIINGRISQRNLYITTFVFKLTAQKPGTFPVGPIRYTYKDYDRQMGSASVTVTKQEAALNTVPTLSKKSAFVGEQVLYTLRIIAGQGVQQINYPNELQKLIGEKFFFQRLDKNIEPKVVKINGQDTRVYDVRIVLFPLLVGKAELSGIPVEYQQVTRGRQRRQGSVFDMFDDDFFGGGQVVTLTSVANPISMEIASLPEGAPADFTGAVGQFSLTATADKTTLASGEALTLTITIRGDGQPKTLTKPRLPDLSQFEVFDPEITSTSTIQGTTLVSTKTFKYVIVPHRKGEYNLGPVAFPYFDPNRKIFTEAKSQPITLTVTQGKESEAAPTHVMSQREITDIGSDIRHIKIGNGALHSEDDFLYRELWYWLLFLPSPIVFGLLLVIRRRSHRLQSDATLKRKTQASAQLRLRLKEANEALKQKNSRDFYKALSQAVVGFVSDKLNIEFRGLTEEEAKAKLVVHGLPEAISVEYGKLLQLCDFGQFGGSQRDDKTWKEALDTAETLLRKLDREL